MFKFGNLFKKKKKKKHVQIKENFKKFKSFKKLLKIENEKLTKKNVKKKSEKA